MEEQNKNVEETQQEEVKKEHKPFKRFIVIGFINQQMMPT